MHMVQHILLLDIVPILFNRQPHQDHPAPGHAPPAAARACRGPLAHPVAAVVLYVAVMWTWQCPALYDAALRHPLLHAFEHTWFMTAGVL